jgi:hypothetical protein
MAGSGGQPLVAEHLVGLRAYPLVDLGMLGQEVQGPGRGRRRGVLAAEQHVQHVAEHLLVGDGRLVLDRLDQRLEEVGRPRTGRHAFRASANRSRTTTPDQPPGDPGDRGEVLPEVRRVEALGGHLPQPAPAVALGGETRPPGRSR